MGSPGVKRPEREADHEPPSSAEVKNELVAQYQVSNRDNFTFTFTFEKWVSFTPLIREVPGSNLGRVTGCRLS
jgi:hypothetical protein